MTMPGPKVGALERTSGHDRDWWFAALDGWDAAGKPYRELHDWLTGAGLSPWWAQKVIVEYEEARGVRQPNVQRDGTFQVGASKAIDAPVDRILAAFADPEERAAWLSDAPIDAVEQLDGDRVRFAWDGGPSRVTVSVETTGSRPSVTVLHERIADGATAQAHKSFWRERLTVLKAPPRGLAGAPVAWHPPDGRRRAWDHRYRPSGAVDRAHGAHRMGAARASQAAGDDRRKPPAPQASTSTEAASSRAMAPRMPRRV